MEEEKIYINEKDLINNIKIESTINFINNIKKDKSQIKLDKNEYKDDNIYIKYLINPNIIFEDKKDINNNINKNNLKSLFNELNKDMEKRNNIIFPFLEIFPNLVKAYIESDLDDYNNVEEKEIFNINESIYLKTFEKLKNNCFINKEALFPIYDYFKYLYDILVESKESKKEDDTFLNKFYKMVKLFEIFYEINNMEKENNISSFCFIGGSMCLEFNEEYDISKICPIEIKINILNSDYISYIKDELCLIKIKEEEFNNIDLKKNINNQKLKAINFKIDSETIKIEFQFEEKYFGFSEKIKLKKIKNITLLEDFYGQISSLTLSIGKNNNKIEYSFEPISLRNENIIFPKKRKNNEEKSKEKVKLKDIKPIIKINNKNLVGINYINYQHFDIIDYYGGIIQFLPFYPIIKNL